MQAVCDPLVATHEDAVVRVEALACGGHAATRNHRQEEERKEVPWVLDASHEKQGERTTGTCS